MMMPFYRCKWHRFIANTAFSFLTLMILQTKKGRGLFLFKKCLKDLMKYHVSDCTYLDQPSRL